MQLVPAIFATLVAGLLTAAYQSLPGSVCWSLLALLLLLVVFLRPSNPVLLTLALLACFLFAHLFYPLQFRTDPLIERADRLSQVLSVEAIVVAIEQRADQRSSLDLQVISLADADEDWPVSDPFVLRLFLDQQPDGLLPGDKIGFSGRLRQPRQFGMPGEFDWPRSLASQGVQATSWLQDVATLQVTPAAHFSLLRPISIWKNSAREFINATLVPDRAGLVRGMVLGEGRSLPAATRGILAASGISHLFAISGLHLGLLALFGYRLLLLVYRRFDRLLLWQPPQRLLPLLLLPLLLGYLLLTGDAVATRRAFCLALVVAVLLLWRRHVQPLRLLLSLALLFLLVNPLLLWQPSWQLSFAGAAGIILWRPGWQDSVQHLPGYVKVPVALLLVTLAATVATLPLVLLNFHLFAPAGPLANLLCVPLVTLLALPSGLLGLVLLPILPMLAGYCFSCCGLILELTLTIAGWLIRLPGLAGQYHFLTNQESLALFVCLVPLVLFWQFKSFRSGPLLAGGAFFCALLLWLVQPTGQTTTLTMFSVGQGEALLLNNAQQQAILVDGGGLYSDSFDVGERLLAPALGALGVKSLAAVVLTHDHPDHRKGLLFVLKHFPVEQFWSAVPLLELNLGLQQLIVEKGLHFRQFTAGWTSTELWPDSAIKIFRVPGPADNLNDSSLVIFLQDRGNGLLLTGDLQYAGVGELLAAGFPGPVSLLKLPHHGSRHSGTERLLRRLQPQTCLVSAGYNNRYRLPASQLLSYLSEQQIALFRTDLQGTIQLQSTPQGWLSVGRDQLFR